MTSERTENPLSWGDTFKRASSRMLMNDSLGTNLKNATRTIRGKRDTRVGETPDWDELRDAAAALKRYSLDHLPELLVELEENVKKRGGHVHWAVDAEEANRIAYDLIKETGSDEVVKVKSMATQEIGLNEYLEARGIRAIETDLAELIVQLAGEAPSHIVVPAIHKNRDEIENLFKETLGEDAPSSSDPEELTRAARAYLRKKFLEADVAISGANMMIADSGTLGVVESEGNGRMCLTLPNTLISIVGVEKVLPTWRDAEVIMQLLPRSATGEVMNPYTSWWTGVTPGDGPQNFHLILLDNGRSRVLADPVGRDALACIRCGACMNICPVYAHVGGHAYQSVYPGPIGAILTPQLLGAFEAGDPAAELPFASTLCGACYEVCPVKIDIPSILLDLRSQKVEQEKERGTLPTGFDALMKSTSYVLSSGRRMRLVESALPVARIVGGKKGRLVDLPWPVSVWTDSRDVPSPPEEPFRSWAKQHGLDGKKRGTGERK